MVTIQPNPVYLETGHGFYVTIVNAGEERIMPLSPYHYLVQQVRFQVNQAWRNLQAIPPTILIDVHRSRLNAADAACQDALELLAQLEETLVEQGGRG